MILMYKIIELVSYVQGCVCVLACVRSYNCTDYIINVTLTTLEINKYSKATQGRISFINRQADT